MADYQEYYRGKTILVTGGAGAIGSNLCHSLADLGTRTIVLDDLSASELWTVPLTPSIHFIEGDILDDVKLNTAFHEKPQIVYHLAALFANQNSVDHPHRDLMVNGLGTLRLLEQSVLAGVERFVYASSSSIYGSQVRFPLSEDLISMKHSTPYQITKMMGELYCNFFHSHYGLKVVKPRFFNSYGPKELPGQYRNVIPNFIYWAMKGLPLSITGTGEETRDFTYIGDIVDGLLRMGYFDSATGQALNLASGKETQIVELAHMVNELAGNEAGIQLVGRRKWDTSSRRLADIDRARSLIGYQPRTSLQEGLQSTIFWFQTNWDRIGSAERFSPGTPSSPE